MSDISDRIVEQRLEELAEEGNEMGSLKDLVNSRSKYFKIEFGETSLPMIYKGFKPVVNTFGQDTIRYTFEFATEQGFITKTFDCGNNGLALQLDEIPFGTQIMITKEYVVDDEGHRVKTSNGYDAASYVVKKFELNL